MSKSTSLLALCAWHIYWRFVLSGWSTYTHGVHGGGQGGVREETLRKTRCVSASPLHKDFLVGGVCSGMLWMILEICLALDKMRHFKLSESTLGNRPNPRISLGCRKVWKAVLEQVLTKGGVWARSRILISLCTKTPSTSDSPASFAKSTCSQTSFQTPRPLGVYFSVGSLEDDDSSSWIQNHCFRQIENKVLWEAGEMRGETEALTGDDRILEKKPPRYIFINS